VFKRFCHWTATWASWIQSTLSQQISFQIYFKTTLPSTSWFSKLSSPVWFFSTKLCTHISYAHACCMLCSCHLPLFDKPHKSCNRIRILKILMPLVLSLTVHLLGHISFSDNYFMLYQIKMAVMGRKCIKYGRDEKYIQNFGRET